MSDLDHIIPDLLREHRVPGLSAAHICEGKPTWSGAYGLARSNPAQPVRENTIFEAASLSKPIVAHAALLLCEAGQLHLDTPLTQYLPDPFVPDEPRLPLITLRDVLRHTTGFPNWRKGSRLQLRFTPGDRFSYSGEGFAYLQQVIERITKQSLHNHIQELVFAPLGMSKSSFIWCEPMTDKAAQGHDPSEKPTTKWQPTKAIAAASLHTTATDFAKFLYAVLHPGNAPGCLSPATTTELLKSQVRVAPGVSWGLGWAIQHTARGNAFFHWGNSGSFQTFATGWPDRKEALVLLTNSGNGLKVCQRVVNLLFGNDQPGWDFIGS